MDSGSVDLVECDLSPDRSLVVGVVTDRLRCFFFLSSLLLSFIGNVTSSFLCRPWQLADTDLFNLGRSLLISLPCTSHTFPDVDMDLDDARRRAFLDDDAAKAALSDLVRSEVRSGVVLFKSVVVT